MEDLIQDILKEVKAEAKTKVKRKLHSFLADNEDDKGIGKDKEEGVNMEVKTEKIKGGYLNEHLKVNDKEKPKCPPQLPQLPANIACFAPVGKGKTNAITNLLKWYEEYGSITDIYVISPTFDNNPAFKFLKHIDKENVYKNEIALNESFACLEKIKKAIEIKVAKWEAEVEYKKAYDAYFEGKATLDQKTLLENHLFREPDVPPKPSPVLLLDDMAQTEIYKSVGINEFCNLVMLNRHFAGVGITIIMLIQSFKAIPKRVRQNLNVFLLWKTHDGVQFDTIYEEVAVGLTKDQFTKVFNIATQKDHDFLYIDMRAKNPEGTGIDLRRNFDTALIVHEAPMQF